MLSAVVVHTMGLWIDPWEAIPVLLISPPPPPQRTESHVCRFWTRALRGWWLLCSHRNTTIPIPSSRSEHLRFFLVRRGGGAHWLADCPTLLLTTCQSGWLRFWVYRKTTKLIDCIWTTWLFEINESFVFGEFYSETVFGTSRKLNCALFPIDLNDVFRQCLHPPSR